MKEDTIQHLASEMDELQEQHRDVLAKVRPFPEIRELSIFSNGTLEFPCDLAR